MDMEQGVWDVVEWGRKLCRIAGFGIKEKGWILLWILLSILCLVEVGAKDLLLQVNARECSKLMVGRYIVIMAVSSSVPAKEEMEKKASGERDR
jgi:hypothetical protein